jgi:hypothetical protein
MSKSKTKRSEAMGIETTGSDGMKSGRLQSKGFTLIASLLMLLLLSGIAIGLLMMVNTEGRVGGTDLQNNLAFHAAEGGIEKMYSDLSTVFQNAQAPTVNQICGVGAAANEPSIVGVNFTQYSVMPGTMQQSTCPASLIYHWGPILSGPNAGLYAQIIPINMLATANLMGNQEVSMTRQAQVALIPVFQFGVFSESDLSFFSGPSLDMAGPVHTNGDLYPFVGPGSTLTFHNQVSVYGNVVRTQLANGYNPSTNYNGTVDVATSSTNGCSTPTTNCTAMLSPFTSSPYGDGSVQGAGGNPAQSTYNGSTWNNFSTGTNLQFINGNYGSKTTPGTGAKILSMPFVSGTTFPYQIIRRSTSSDSTALSQSREYNLAQIRVLLSDDPADLPGGASDANNIRLANITTTQATLQGGSSINPWGITIPAGNYVSGFGTPTTGNTYNLYFAAGSNAVPSTTCVGNACTPDWPYAPAPWTTNPNPALEGLQPSRNELAPIYLNNGTPAIALCPPSNYTGSWPAGCPTTAAYPYYALPNPSLPVSGSNLTPYNSANSNAWSLIDGYLRVEYKNSSGNWNPVTLEWLQLGFARGIAPPTSPGPSTNAGSNPINPNAILLLQEPADRNGSGAVTSTATLPTCTSRTGCSTYAGGTPPEVAVDMPAYVANLTADWAFGLTPTTPTALTPQSITQYNWYPINIYDAREGEVRDSARTSPDNSCTTNGVMNAVEIDVGNLKRWLTGAIGSSGASVDSVAQNGYVLYFSDRRGMLLNPNAPLPNAPNTKSGDSGLEDDINGSVAAGTPNGVLEPKPAGKSIYPEDVNENGVLDNFGATNLGLGFYGTVASATTNLNAQINPSAGVPDPYGTAANARIASCSTTGRKNWVSGARHALRLVDGSLGNVPLVSGGTMTDPGGFTVASENPVYILGPYNSSPPPSAGGTDTTWNATPVDVLGHSSAAVIADAVTLLSSSWTDYASFGIGGDGTVTNPANRTANTDYYRVAIAAGKNINFPQPTWNGVGQDFGTDGGVHNFLRYLENWNGTLNYKGSIVSLYYATYATGIFKCCTVVYNPPNRNFFFDIDFTSPQGLPPGTPMFRDVESLGYRQGFATRQSTY